MLTSFVMVSVLATGGTALASVDLDELKAQGGWDEETGYWSLTNEGDVGIFSKPTVHQGWKEEKNGRYRAVAVTHWDKKHYTRAQL